MTATTTKSATGRRKTAVARVWMTEGTGQITINDRPFEEYLPTIELQNAILAPFHAASLIEQVRPQRRRQRRRHPRPGRSRSATRFPARSPKWTRKTARSSSRSVS